MSDWGTKQLYIRYHICQVSIEMSIDWGTKQLYIRYHICQVSIEMKGIIFLIF
jgi:hypothetical protein